MDIKSIVRVFRFAEMQNRADRDPDAKRPPTVKFMGLALVLGLLLVMISFWSAPQTEVSGAVPLELTTSDPVPEANATSSPVPGEPSQPAAQEGPLASEPGARPEDTP